MRNKKSWQLIIVLFIPFLMVLIMGAVGSSNQLKDCPIYESDCFKKYYRNYWPISAKLREINYELTSKVLGHKLVGGVFEGSEDWLFYATTTDGTPLEDVIYDKKLSPIHIENWNKHIANKDWSKSLLVIPPNKSRMYQEKLSEFAEVQQSEPIYKQVEGFAKSKNIEVIGPSILLPKLSVAEQVRQTYYQKDTHINAWGGFVIYELIYDSIKQKLDLSDRTAYVGECGPPANDLVKMLERYGVKQSEQNSAMGSECLKLEDFGCALAKNEADGEIEHYECEKGKGRLLIVGDSFRGAIKPYLIPHFKETIVVHSSKERHIEPYLKTKDYDYLVEIRVERYLRF